MQRFYKPLRVSDLESALAEGRIEAVGLRNGNGDDQETISRKTWAHYRVVEDFDDCALCVDPNNPDAEIAGSYTIALLKLRGLEHQLAANLRGDGGPVFWTALRFERAAVIEWLGVRTKPETGREVRQPIKLRHTIEALKELYSHGYPTDLPKEEIRTAVEAKIETKAGVRIPVSLSTLDRARHIVFGR